MRKIAAVLIMLPTSLWAEQELMERYGALLVQCYDEATSSEAKSECLGIMSSACINLEEGGESTLGMSQCLYSESEVWDGFLNDEYRQTMAWAKKLDAEEAELFPEFANRAESLRDAQRAWIAFRDAECGLEYSIWGSGSMRHIMGSDCIMRMTAERTVELFEKRDRFK